MLIIRLLFLKKHSFYIIIHRHFQFLTIVMTKGEQLPVLLGSLFPALCIRTDNHYIKLPDLVFQLMRVDHNHIIAGLLTNALDVSRSQYLAQLLICITHGLRFDVNTLLLISLCE